jgi:hypothetical protein
LKVVNEFSSLVKVRTLELSKKTINTTIRCGLNADCLLMLLYILLCFALFCFHFLSVPELSTNPNHSHIFEGRVALYDYKVFFFD